MARTTIFKLARLATRQLSISSRIAQRNPSSGALLRGVIVPSTSTRSISTSIPVRKGISPDSEDPKPATSESHNPAVFAAELTQGQYNELSEEYMDSIVSKLEELQEEREDVDVEYSAGVLTLTFPPLGTYVINKQPPNKQIWLSSPISGPKRYDYVVTSEGQDSKEGTGMGDWVYLRDGTSLNDVLLKEVGVDINTIQ